MGIDGDGGFLDAWGLQGSYDEDTFAPTASPIQAAAPVAPLYEIVDLLNDGQEKAMSLMFACSGILSVMGSSTIVYKVILNRQKATPYDRIMLGLSCCDIVAAIGWILTPFLLPADSSPRVWAIGTDATCTFVGTLTQFGFCAIAYNCILSFYYLMTVRFGVKRHIFARRYEPYLHVFTLLYFLTTSIGGAAVNMYSELDLGMGCWINDFPNGCETEEGNTCLGDEIAWAFGAGPTILTFLALIVNNLIIYCHVKKMLKEEIPSNTSNHGSSNSTLSAFAKREAIATTNMTVSERAMQQERMEQYKRHIQEVASQGFLYVGAFFVAFSPTFTQLVIETYGSYPLAEQPLFPLLLIGSICLPLQGFFNMLIYNRPNFIRVRTAYPNRGLFWATKKACLGSDIPRLIEASRISQRMRSFNRISGSGGSGGGPVGSSKVASNSGNRFSSDLDVVREGSREEDVSDEEHSIVEEELNYIKMTGQDKMDNTAKCTDEWTSGESLNTTVTVTTTTDVVMLSAANVDDELNAAITNRNTTTTTKQMSMPNLTLALANDEKENDHDDDEEYEEGLNDLDKPRSAPDLGSSHDDYSSDEDFDLEDAYKQIFDNGKGGVRRLAFDGSVSHHSAED